MTKPLPGCDEVFSRFFDRWYSDDDRERKGFSKTRPDMLNCYLPGLTAEDICPLNSEAQAEVASRVEIMLAAAREDWRRYLPVEGDIDESWVQAFDDYYDAEQVGRVIEESDPNEFGNNLLVIVCEFGAVLGHVLQQLQPRLIWFAEWPYWESSLYDPISGAVIPTYHWAIKKFSAYGVDDGFVPKLHACIGVLDELDQQGD